MKEQIRRYWRIKDNGKWGYCNMNELELMIHRIKDYFKGWKVNGIEVYASGGVKGQRGFVDVVLYDEKKEVVCVGGTFSLENDKIKVRLIKGWVNGRLTYGTRVFKYERAALESVAMSVMRRAEEMSNEH